MIALHGVALRSRATGQPVFESVDLAVAGGEIALVTGASSSGKSALVGLLCGAVAPESGTVEVFGRDLARLRRSSLVRLRRRLGLVLDEPLLIDDESALANVVLPLELEGVARRERMLRADRALDRVDLAAFGSLPAGLLTAGERRRLALARALIGGPEVLLLDQPTGSLDGAGRALVAALLSEHVAAGACAVVASSDPLLCDAADLLGWTVYELEGGALRRLEPAASDEIDAAVARVDRALHDSAPVVTAHPNVVPFPTSARLGVRE